MTNFGQLAVKSTPATKQVRLTVAQKLTTCLDYLLKLTKQHDKIDTNKEI